MAIEPVNDVAEANLARDLAERMVAEYLRNGFSGVVVIERALSSGVVADACHIFARNPAHISVTPVCYAALGELVVRFK